MGLVSKNILAFLADFMPLWVEGLSSLRCTQVYFVYQINFKIRPSVVKGLWLLCVWTESMFLCILHYLFVLMAKRSWNLVREERATSRSSLSWQTWLSIWMLCQNCQVCVLQCARQFLFFPLYSFFGGFSLTLTPSCFWMQSHMSHII